MKYPFVSIIVPVRNEEKYIGECLEAIFSQTYPKERMEVLVVDGMSEDKTRDIAKKFPVKILDNPNLQRVFALNIGIKHAKGDIILRVDARTRIPENYVQKCIETILETKADNVGGVQRALVEGGALQKAIALAANHHFGVGDAPYRLGTKSGYVDSVYLGCFKKEVFDKVGLFDQEAPIISEDADINCRIIKAGGKVYLNKDIVAYYIPRDNLKDLWRLYFRYGGARAGFFLKHKILRWRQVVPILFVSTLIMLLILALISNNPVIFFIWSSLLGIYFLADIIVSVTLSLGQRDIYLFPFLVLVFPCMHFAWAFGFIRRILYNPKPGEYWKY